MTKNRKPQATKNLAKDVVGPQMKRIDVPQSARNEISRQAGLLDTFIAGMVAGMGIKGPWGFDMKRKQILVPKE